MTFKRLMAISQLIQFFFIELYIHFWQHYFHDIKPIFRAFNGKHFLNKNPF